MIKKILSLCFVVLLLITYSYAQKSPGEFFGIKVGADRTLVKYPGIIKYFKYIAKESGRVKLVNEGQTTLGNSMYLAFISSEENIKRLPELIAVNKKLADPDTLSKGEAEGLLKKGKVFVLITCALHATEIGSTQIPRRRINQSPGNQSSVSRLIAEPEADRPVTATTGNTKFLILPSNVFRMQNQLIFNLYLPRCSRRVKSTLNTKLMPAPPKFKSAPLPNN